MRGILATTLVVGLACGFAGAALTFPVEEQFGSSSNGWQDVGSTPANWIGSGGPDGSGYASVFGSFATKDAGPVSDPNSLVTIFRGETGAGSGNASGGAFIGDWLAAGITEFSFQIRHNAPVALEVWTRFAKVQRSPGVVFAESTLINPNTWTEVRFTIDILSPEFVVEEGPPGTFATVLGDIGHIQIGVVTNTGVARDPASYTFDFDQVRAVPAPSGLAVLGLMAVGTKRRRR